MVAYAIEVFVWLRGNRGMSALKKIGTNFLEDKNLVFIKF